MQKNKHHYAKVLSKPVRIKDEKNNNTYLPTTQVGRQLHKKKKKRKKMLR